MSEGQDFAGYLRYLTYQGCIDRYGIPVHDHATWENFVPDDDPAQILAQRIEHELDTIEKAGFPSYFLIVADLLNFCRRAGIPTGPGRGSVCGSAVAYATGITDVDPIRFGIPFERFLHLDRISMPDVDIDLCQARRDEVIQYLRDKYGNDAVAQIITFGTLMAKGVIKDVCRVLHVDDTLYGERSNKTGEKLAAMIPDGSGADQVKLQEFYESEEGTKFRAELDRANELYKKATGIDILETCYTLEGLRRHGSVHAAGVVIADRPLIDLVPLYRRNQQSDVQIQYDMIDAEEIGLLKLDVLGLRTVTVIGDAEKAVREIDPDFSIKDVPLDDQATFDIISAGRTVGIFQLEGEGITGAITGVKPDRFEDIIAVLALYRPGPMEQLGSFIHRKHGEEEITYPHPDVASVLKDTYGLIIYQEQVMGMARTLAGYTPGEADMFRKAIGKKLPELIAKEIAVFTERAIERGYDKDTIQAIGAQIAYFGRYGFNLGHATGYAFITYWTAYLKAHYPGQFYAALLNSYLGDRDRVATVLADAAKAGIRVLGPDINESDRGFALVGEDTIRFGIEGVKGLGGSMVLDILEERDSHTKNGYERQRVARVKPDGTEYMASIKVTARVPNEPRLFSSIADFCARLTHVPINAKVALATAGAFGSDMEERKRIVAALPAINDAAKKGTEYSWEDYDGPVMSDIEVMKAEREIMGFYVTSHPLDMFREDLNGYGAAIDGSFDSLPTNCTVAGVVTQVRTHQARNGEMAWVALETGIDGLPDITIFNDTWVQVQGDIQKDEVLIVRGKKNYHPKFGWGLQATAAFVLDRARPDAKAITICAHDTDVADVAMLDHLTNPTNGAAVLVAVEDQGRIALIRTGRRFVVTGASLSQLRDIWPIRIDQEASAPLPWADGGEARRIPGVYKGVGGNRIPVYDLPLIKMVTSRLGGKVLCEMETVDDAE